MAVALDILAEARIRDWQRRKASGECAVQSTGRAAPLAHDAGTLQTQLLQRVLELLERAARAEPEERAKLDSTARELETRLMVLLEDEGLGLAARRIAAQLEQRRAGWGQRSQP
ncbi:MAG TPA: hypothetical protein VFQ61_05945 [Polyangiaceae bacterium]|nr:hypothetical protein [Polyangiaceae bacterium]